jgi:ribonuclease D
MIPYTFVQEDRQLESYIAALRSNRITRLAIDVEGENNLHSYGIHVALIQLFDGTRGAVVDVLAIRDRSLLKQLLEHAPWVLVWFDAANDLLSFQHALSIRPSPIRDLAIAARLLGRQGGLHAMTGQPGTASTKDKFQKSNWMRRPLSRALLDYAISDVTHLLPLDESFDAELREKGLREEFNARNRIAEEAERTWDPWSNFVRIPGYNRLPPDQQRFARLLWYARELYGQQHDLPPGNVASKQDMRAIIDRGLRNADGIAGFLNQSRKNNRVSVDDLDARLAEADGLISTGSGPGKHERRSRR